MNLRWTLEGELSALLPVLAQRLGRDGKDRNRGDFRLNWLAGERPAAAPVTPWPLSSAAHLVSSSTHWQ